jgi:mannan endo-1,4-beta-mannosidase
MTPCLKIKNIAGLKIRLILLIAALVMTSNLSDGTAQARAGFVTTAGTHFELDGRPFYFQGTNAISFGTTVGEPEDKIYAAMREYASLGLRVVRMWGFSCSGYLGGSAPILEWANENQIGYNETGFQRLDAALDAARAAGLKVILPLVNFEPSYCGMEWWTNQVIHSGDKHLFYTDSRVKLAFKRHVENLLNRVNSRYRSTIGKSIRYKDDPTIMAIEIANEPHTEDYYEYNRGLPPGELVYNFLNELSWHVRKNDPNHLISSGEEGYKTTIDGGADTYDHVWINNGSKGVNFEKNVTLSQIDFATVHVYPDNWNIPSNQMYWVEERLMKRRADIAHASGKPIVLEESGFNADPSWQGYRLGYGGSPAWYLSKMYEYANRYDYAGTVIWQLMPRGFSVGGYDYDTASPVADVVKRQAWFMNSR